MHSFMVRWLLSATATTLFSFATVATAADETAAGAASKDETAALAARVKEVFRTRCSECHSGAKANSGVRMLNHKLLVEDKKVIVPGEPDKSQVYTLMTAGDESVMPPEGQPRLSPEEIDAVRQWIVAGAPAFPADVTPPPEKTKDPGLAEVSGVDYVHKKILQHVRDTEGEQRQYLRYFSTNHLLQLGATRQMLDQQRDALAKAINHLSLEKKIVRPKSIDTPTDTIFVVDIRQLGWQKQPFSKIVDGAKAGPSKLTLYDLALLEYPYAISYEDSETFDRLVHEFVKPAGIVRPIIYLRADWFTSIATQSPLYDDFLGLPHELDELEARLNVDVAANIRDGIAKRAAVTVSGVSRNNRGVERHPLRSGSYWKSFDFASSKGNENIFRNPIDMNPTGGEMIFSLPNGLQGYLITAGNGRRIDVAPTEIVTDKFAEDKAVRNGLSCIRCHEHGMKNFADNVRPALERLPGSPGFDKRHALQLYVKQQEMDELLKEDTERFSDAMKEVLGKSHTGEPLTAVTQRFIDGPLSLSAVGAELGLADTAGLKHLARQPHFTTLGMMSLASDGIIRRDMWEDYFDQVVRQLGLGVPVVPLDAISRTEYAPTSAVDVGLKTNKKNNVFAPDEELVITVTNNSHKMLHFELIGTSAKGEKVVLAAGKTIAAGSSFRFPETGSIKIQPSLGKEHVTLFASDAEFPAGELLRGVNVADRFVHPFSMTAEGVRAKVTFDPARIVKKTVSFETK